MRNREVEEETRLHFQESFPNHRIGDLPLQTWGLKIEDGDNDDHDEDDEDDTGDDKGDDDEDDECDDDAITDLSQRERLQKGFFCISIIIMTTTILIIIIIRKLYASI